MGFIKPLGLKKSSKKYKKFLPIAISLLMLGSLFVSFSFPTDQEKVGLRVSVVDPVLGSMNDLYNGDVEISGNTTAVELVQGAGMPVEVGNGTFVCVREWCNDGQEWEFYVNGQFPSRGADELFLENGDQVLLIYR